MTTFVLLTLMATSPDLNRLERLADRLDVIPAARYDMDRYGTSRHPDDPDFVGGAAEHAAAVFARDGFTLAPVPYRPGRFEAAYKGFRGQAAVREFFGLTAADAGDLIESRDVDPRDPRAISARICRFVARERRERRMRP